MVFLGIATKSISNSVEWPEAVDRSSGGQLRESVPMEGGSETARPTRAKEPGSKLRSLFDVRKGEISALSIPPDAMARLLTQIPQPTDDSGGAVPQLVGVFDRELMITSLGSAENSIRGTVDTTEGTFEMKAGKLNVSGSAFIIEDTTRLQVMLSDGANGFECLSRVPDGRCLLFSSGGEHPEGVLIVPGPREVKQPESESNQ
jgi:hypothetical protein